MKRIKKFFIKINIEIGFYRWKDKDAEFIRKQLNKAIVYKNQLLEEIEFNNDTKESVLYTEVLRAQCLIEFCINKLNNMK